VAASPTGHTGQSDEIHSLDAWARTVVNRINPASVSNAVGLDCRNLLLSKGFANEMRPLESEAYRKVRSPLRGKGDRMVALRDFSGFLHLT
jgi:hypothetical protein